MPALRYAFRGLRHAPAFTFGVVLVLALGIGASASVFSALDQTVIRPLPYTEPDRLAMIWEDFSAFGTPKNRVSPATYLDWAERTRAFQELAAMRITIATVTEPGPPEQILGAAVTANLLPLVGVAPAMGRVLTAEEERPGHRVVVLSDRLWRRRFGADTGIVGRSILLSDESFTVIGVMPPGFLFPNAKTEFWQPIAFTPAQITARNSHYLHVFGRLRPGVTWAAAREDMTTIARQLGSEHPRSNDRVGITVTPLPQEVTADSSRALLLLFGAAACVLLIGCANVANLLIARVSARRREIGVRLALGASRGRLICELLVESLMLASAGGLAGLALARWGLRALTHFIPPALVTSVDLHLDARAVVFSIVVSAVTAIVVGLAPALHSVSRATIDSLRVRLGAGGDRSGTRLRRVLVIVEIAIALVLVAAAALLIDTLARLRSVDPGFRTDHVLTAEIEAPMPKYADADRRRQFYQDVVDRLSALPGIDRAGLTSDLPYTARGNTMSLSIEGRASTGLSQDALFRLVSTNYLQTMDARLREGRLLDDGDRAGTMPVAVVNDALARLYWPNESAIGHRIDTGTGNGAPLWMTIVGVVDDLKEQGLDYGPRAAVYVPFNQTTISFFVPSAIAVRTHAAPEAMASALQQAIWSVDPQQPIMRLRTMDDIVDVELGDRQQMLSLVGTFAGVALFLAAVGIYSVLSYLVSERRREIGVRIAIGASTGRVMRDVLGQSAGLAAIGVAAGVACAIVCTRWLGALLFHVSPVDPIVLAGVSALVLGVSLVASFVPARRAATVDPMTVLRGD
jgi:predicted permease